MKPGTSCVYQLADGPSVGYMTMTIGGEMDQLYRGQ